MMSLIVGVISEIRKNCQGAHISEITSGLYVHDSA